VLIIVLLINVIITITVIIIIIIVIVIMIVMTSNVNLVFESESKYLLIPTTRRHSGIWKSDPGGRRSPSCSPWRGAFGWPSNVSVANGHLDVSVPWGGRWRKPFAM